MRSPDPSPAPSARHRLVVRGLVQGVGFRPYVSRLAEKHRLAGTVRNEAAGVVIEVEGAPLALAAFREELPLFAPPLAVIAAIETAPVRRTDEKDFRIVPSGAGERGASARIPPDVATCGACLRELRDPADRRFRYPFINCTDCGPRYTIVSRLPYDRDATTMRRFRLCAPCREEYENPRSRRHHAQPNACPACGPRVRLLDAEGREIPCADPIAETALRLAGGAIAAIKGIGGFHLACDATDAAVVRRLRERKRRPEKPLAVMARDLETVERLADLTAREREILTDWRRPILLCQPHEPAALPPEVGGTSRLLGVFLPYSPLHHLLLDGPRSVLVMTSGNRTDEPIARENEEALSRLRGLADLFLVHDREILHSADDSIARVMLGRPVLLRRSRGYVPQPVILPASGPSVLAFGADLKGTCCVTREELAFSSPYLGDLAHPQAAALLERSAEHLLRLLDVRPERIVHDLHPDYASTRVAERIARRLGVPTLAVQHHHAHALAVLAEHGRRRPALAAALDGAGYGTDGQVWGGELLVVDGPRARRFAHFRHLPMPGGDRAAVEPWRMALAAMHLAAGGAGARWPERWRTLAPFAAAPPSLVAGIETLLAEAGARPVTSSAGRLFDAAASILGLRQRMSYEGQAATELEDAARESASAEAYPIAWIDPPNPAGEENTDPAVIDTAPLFRALLDDAVAGKPVAVCARRFHQAIVESVRQGAARGRARTGLDLVVLSGGVMQNRLLFESLTGALEADGFEVLAQQQLSPNDEGVALGQAWAGMLSFSGEKAARGDSG